MADRTVTRRAPFALTAALIAACACGTFGQSAEPAPSPESGQKDEEKKPAAAPSLDELLGLPGAKKNEDGSVKPDDVTEKQLDEALASQEEINDEFKLALREMRETADRLEYSFDTGTTTQRLQQSVIRRLEELIEAAENQQQSSSSSSQQSSQSQQPNQPQQDKSKASQGPGSSEQASVPPGGREGELRDTLDTARAAWGSLPERVREALQQGSGDYFSRMYESLTESYYKRLAEEGTER